MAAVSDLAPYTGLHHRTNRTSGTRKPDSHRGAPAADQQADTGSVVGLVQPDGECALVTAPGPSPAWHPTTCKRCRSESTTPSTSPATTRSSQPPASRCRLAAPGLQRTCWWPSARPTGGRHPAPVAGPGAPPGRPVERKRPRGDHPVGPPRPGGGRGLAGRAVGRRRAGHGADGSGGRWLVAERPLRRCPCAWTVFR